MIPSIRTRLAIWYGAALALSLAIFAAAGFVFVARTSLDVTDASLDEAMDAVVSAIGFEERQKQQPDTYLGPIVEDFRFRDLKIAILDRATGKLYIGADSASDATPDSVTVADPADTADVADGTPDVVLDADEMRLLMLRAPATGKRVFTTSAGEDDEEVRVVVRPVRVGHRMLVLAAAHELRNRARMLKKLTLALAGGIPLLLLAAVAGGWLLARQSLRQVAVMTERAATIGAATLHERLPVDNPGDELGRLAAVFNDLLARLDQAFEQQRQFMADASHELRTPVAIMSGEAELALSRDDRPMNELRGSLTNIRHESRRLKRIVDDLFLLARANAGEQLLVPEALYLGELAQECVRSARSLAAAKHIDLRAEGDEELPVTGDEAMLRRLVMNLLDNAIKYTPAGGRVVLRAAGEEGACVLEVSDTGPGIPAAARARLFDRFYRARRERALDRESGGGAGLGLAISRWIAESHGGTISLARSDEGGSTFRVVLPASVRPSSPSIAVESVSS